MISFGRFVNLDTHYNRNGTIVWDQHGARKERPNQPNGAGKETKTACGSSEGAFVDKD